MLDSSQIVRAIDGYLYLLGWSRECPRVRAFLQEISRRTGQNYSLDNMPYKYLAKLEDFLKIYWQCDQMIRKLNLSWDAPVITELTADYGGCEKMPILGWQHLSEALEHQYFLMDMPTAKESKRKLSKGYN